MELEFIQTRQLLFNLTCIIGLAIHKNHLTNLLALTRSDSDELFAGLSNVQSEL